MRDVTGSFPDLTHPLGKRGFYLDCDKGLNIFDFQPPITWTGAIDGNEVIIVQNSTTAISKDDFVFETFPKKYLDAMPYIIEAIDKCLEVLD